MSDSRAEVTLTMDMLDALLGDLEGYDMCEVDSRVLRKLIEIARQYV